MSAPLHPLILAPFAEVFVPWMERGLSRLRAAIPALNDVLAGDAVQDLGAGLLHELASAAAPTLVGIFQRQPWRRSFSRNASHDRDAFMRDLAEGGLAGLFADFPALRPLLDVLVDDWCSRSRHAVDRIEGDRGLLASVFGFEAPVARLEPIAGGGLVLTDARGVRVVYKARPLGLDRALCELIRWINAQDAGLPLFVPAVIDRGRFGWMQHVPSTPPSKPGERQHYLMRTGMLVCLAHALGAGDLHADNVRAYGEHPVVLDAEVLLRPRRTGLDARSASPLSTGWLPTPVHVELSGLACEHFARLPRWHDAGSDAVRPAARVPWRARLRERVRASLKRDGQDGIAAICAGFSALYRCLCTRRLPLDVVAGADVRVLLRPTRSYVDAIERSLDPEHLVSTRTRNVVVDKALEQSPLPLRHVPQIAAAVRQAEALTVARLDVPRFTMPATGGELQMDGEALGNPDFEAPIARARRFLSEMRVSSLDAQCRAIAASVATVAMGADYAPEVWT